MEIQAGEKSTSGGAQSIDRALGLLSLVASGDGRGVPITFLTDASGLSRPTVRRMMIALIRAGFVEQDAQTRAYHLGPESYIVGQMAVRRFDLLGLAMGNLLALSAESGDSSFLSVRRGSYAVCLHREEGSYPIRTQALQAGDRHPLGVGAGSMAILAALPEAERRIVRDDVAQEIRRHYAGYTVGVIDKSVAIAEAQGWALNPGQLMANSWGIGVALRAPTGDVIGAVSIAALDSRMQPDRQPMLAELLTREARAIERKLERRLAY
ncbi:IclR family transcriptional regulator [Litorivita pollutaquae]|uniref:IclR family transcriptional regulator n=1 Tax=Litorivita pollutaquae TaxID=2200892 RepID=UPI000B57F9B7|nr:IclR family transcriptional regulator [Litorivita pollutaquae]OUS20461.1 transcriptional regulator [Rhodobacterales bacterium 59_46_T64]